MELAGDHKSGITPESDKLRRLLIVTLILKGECNIAYIWSIKKLIFQSDFVIKIYVSSALYVVVTYSMAIASYVAI